MPCAKPRSDGKVQDKAEIATLQAEFAMMAAQVAAIRKLRKK
jgi:hypothetical protein